EHVVRVVAADAHLRGAPAGRAVGVEADVGADGARRRGQDPADVRRGEALAAARLELAAVDGLVIAGVRPARRRLDERLLPVAAGREGDALSLLLVRDPRVVVELGVVDGVLA